MSQYPLRLPDSLLKQARKTAKRDSVSMNQLFITAITEDLIFQRAARADLSAFKRILDRVADVPPMPGDEIIN